MKNETLAAQKRAPTIVTFADVEIQEIKWLWWPYVPLGKLTVLEGDPGDGKTTIGLTLAASISRGWGLPQQDGRPGESREPAHSLYMTAEDGLGDTLRPRLEAAGADLTRVHALTGWTEIVDGETIEGAVFLGNVDLLRQTFQRVQPRLVVIDPLQGFLGADVDMHRANEVRPILTALSRLAEQHECAVIAIRHLGKSFKGRAIYSGLGSIDFAAAARSILLVGQHQGQRLMAHVKSSLAPNGKTLKYVLRDGTLDWAGTSDVNPDDMLVTVRNASDATREDEARDFLTDMLSDGPQPVRELRRLARDAGIASRTLDRAKQALGITSHRIGKLGSSGEWVWKNANPQEDGALGALSNESRSEQQNQERHDGADNGALRPTKCANQPLSTPLSTPHGDVQKDSHRQ